MSNNSSDNKPKQYSAQSIKVMEGLEAVRKRPGMYIGSTGPNGLHHLVYEVVDNSVDEALAGHCTTIKVVLHDDDSCSVQDDGRGIPTDIHPTEGISAAEVVMTKLHAGGKFDKDSYKFSGGLHGVGISVVNALSESLKVVICQNGKMYEQHYRRGKPVDRLAETGTSTTQGTLVHFKPDSQIFTETTVFSYEKLAARFRELAFLNKGLTIAILDERTGKHESFFFEGGIVSFIEHINKKKSPLFNEVLYLHQEDENYIFECALQYNEGYGEQLYSFVNNINTIEGGTHVAGFKAALTKACNKRALEIKLIKEGGETFSSEDVREGLVAIISIKIPEPQFEGQTKTKLGNSEIKGFVNSWLFSFLDTYFEENPAVARKILQKAEIAMRAREAAKKAREITRRKSVLESTILPGKLTDCSSEEPSQCEIFIVEGDSAGGSAKNGRDRFTQAILPLRGKILNVEKARIDRALSNEEIKALISSIGCGIDRGEFDITKARYHKIILMTDADYDGSHIRTLLLTFFFRYMKPIIEQGYLYIAKPPLYKAKIGKKEQYLLDEKEFRKFLVDWARDNTTFTSNEMSLNQAEWGKLLQDSMTYEEKLDHVAQVFHIPAYECDMIIMALIERPWQKGLDLEPLIEYLRILLPKYSITHEQQVDQKIGNDTIIFELQGHTVMVNLTSLVSRDFAELMVLRKLLTVGTQPWTLHAIGKDKEINGSTILEISQALKAISKPYMYVQRYKGLGEMNPDQLWETAMDPAQRVLLQVTLDDALKADEWFTTLMGDDVPGRRAFIIEGGHFVKNIDA